MTDDSFHGGPRNTRCKACAKIADKGRIRYVYVPSSNWTESARRRKRIWASLNKDPIKAAARTAVRRAIESGSLTRPELCSNCGNQCKRVDGVSAIQAHHYLGYSNHIEVKWLCPKCHRKADLEMKREVLDMTEDKP